MEGLVALDVRDDGVAFEPNVKHANGSVNGGIGLTGMRQRAQWLAGRLEIESEPGAGTSVPAIPAGGAARTIDLVIVDDHPVVRDGAARHVCRRRAVRGVRRGGRRRGGDREARQARRAVPGAVRSLTFRNP
jgi:hypothetical protein